MEIKLGTNVQDAFLTEAKEQQTPFVIYTMNGYQIRGQILDFDETALLVQSEGRKQLVYKHALSTIAEIDLQNDTRSRGFRV